MIHIGTMAARLRAELVNDFIAHVHEVRSPGPRPPKIDVWPPDRILSGGQTALAWKGLIALANHEVPAA